MYTVITKKGMILPLASSRCRRSPIHQVALAVGGGLIGAGWPALFQASAALGERAISTLSLL